MIVDILKKHYQHENYEFLYIKYESIRLLICHKHYTEFFHLRDETHLQIINYYIGVISVPLQEVV